MQIYPSFFDNEALEDWTTGCNQDVGERIYIWNKESVNITQEMNSPLNVSFIRKSKEEICPDPNLRESIQKASKLAGQVQQKRFKPKVKDGAPYAKKLVELITAR